MPATEQQKRKLMHDLSQLKRMNPLKWADTIKQLIDMSSGGKGKIDSRGNSTRDTKYRNWSDVDFIKILKQINFATEEKQNSNLTTKEKIEQTTNIFLHEKIQNDFNIIKDINHLNHENSNKNIVLCSYLNHKEDPQRKIVWNDDYQKLIPLIESVTKNNVEIYVFHNCFDNPPKINFCNWIKIEPNNDYVPTVARWFIYKEFLDNLKNKPNAIFMVDSTDVIMLHNPFSNLKDGILYVGDEEHTKVENNWMRSKERYFIPPNDYRKTIETHAKKNLINAGLVGGKYEIAMQFLIEHCKNHENHSKNVEISTCMPIFNYTVWKNFTTKHFAGFPVNTVFKKNESNSKAWWKHK